MFNYTDLTTYLTDTAKKHPNIQFVTFNTDVDGINDPNFMCPALIISPSPSTLFERSVVSYGIQLLYVDKLREEEDNYDDVLEAGLQFLIGFIEVIDLEYKVVKGITIEPVLNAYEGGIIIGNQCNIQIEHQYNLDKFKSPFYG